MLSSFNTQIIRLMLTIVFYYGSKLSDLLKLKIYNYDPEKKLISFAIKPDPLLKQDIVYIPVHSPLDRLIDSMLESRHRVIATNPNDFLFSGYTKGYFTALAMDQIKDYFTALSAATGEKINERSLYLSHRCYFETTGGLNPIIVDAISNRKAVDVYISRLYTRLTLQQVRQKHFEAFRRVRNFLGIDGSEKCYSIAGEQEITIGGKRAVGPDAISAIFSHFKGLDLTIFEAATKWITFLINYLTGSRVTEITTLKIRSIDFGLNLIKFRVKDTARRKNTTKVLPLSPFLRAALEYYCRLRSEMLSSNNKIDFPYLLFKITSNGPTALTDDDVNEFYLEIALACLIELFTSHALRYQTQTDMTIEELRFTFTNCVLSHYHYWDTIFSKNADISFLIFSEEYLAVTQKLIEKVI